MLKLLERLHLARGVALQCEGKLLLRNAAAVVGNQYALQSSALNAHFNAVGTRINGIFNEFLDDGGRPLNHLACGDLTDELGRKFLNGTAGHGCVEPKSTLL